MELMDLDDFPAINELVSDSKIQRWVLRFLRYRARFINVITATPTVGVQLSLVALAVFRSPTELKYAYGSYADSTFLIFIRPLKLKSYYFPMLGSVEYLPNSSSPETSWDRVKKISKKLRKVVWVLPKAGQPPQSPPIGCLIF